MTTDTGVVGWTVEAEIKPAKLEQFLLVTDEMVSVAAAEPGTLVYERYLDETRARAHFVERYRDAEAAVSHLQTYRERFAGLLESVMDRRRVHVYGSPSNELAALLAPLQPVFMARVAGFARSGPARTEIHESGS